MVDFYYDPNADENNVGSEFDPIPRGDYEAIATDADVRETKSGGTMVAITFTVISPEFTNRKLWANFNIRNNSRKAEEIGRHDLNSLIRACGKSAITNTDELLSIPIVLSVDVKFDEYRSENTNVIKKYKPHSSNGNASVSPPKTEQVPQPQTTNSEPNKITSDPFVR